MKRIVSVSLGSSTRDHQVDLEILGQHIRIERIGTDGDIQRANALMRELDGKVEALGVGGTDLYLRAGNRKYLIRDAARMVEGVHRTPIVDGSGLKVSWERWLITDYLPNACGISFRGKKVLLVSAVDRNGMAESFVDAGAEVIFGDLIFALGLPIPLRTLRSVNILAAILLPILTKIPFKYLYPTGKKQDEITPKHEKYFAWADVIAGDFHLIRRCLPNRLEGKIVVTNTITLTDVNELRKRGAWLLITDGPEMNGRSFGTNVLQGVVVALKGARPEDIPADAYMETLLRAGVRPRVEVLTGPTPAPSSSLEPVSTP